MKFDILYNMQKDLDANINSLHNTTYETTLDKRIMAFVVELGEYANETRCFKYWSLKGPSAKEICLEEYIDGLHFILSIGLALNCDINKEYEYKVLDKDKTEQFLEVYNLATNLFKNKSLDLYYEMMQEFINLGSMFNFTYEDYIEAYKKKNEINYQRQENKY